MRCSAWLFFSGYFFPIFCYLNRESLLKTSLQVDYAGTTFCENTVPRMAVSKMKPLEHLKLVQFN